MTTVADRLVALNKSQVETGFAAIGLAVQGWEQWVDLNLEAGRALLRESVEQSRALVAAEDGAAWKSWSTGLAQRHWERSYGYSRNVYDILVGTGTAIGEVLEQKLLDSSQDWMEMIESATVNSPVVQSEATVLAVKSAMANATAVIEGISKAARQAAGNADTTVKAAAAATAEAVIATAGKKVQ
jgi:phasin family protein